MKPKPTAINFTINNDNYINDLETIQNIYINNKFHLDNHFGNLQQNAVAQKKMLKKINTTKQ